MPKSQEKRARKTNSRGAQAPLDPDPTTVTTGESQASQARDPREEILGEMRAAGYEILCTYY